MVLQLVVLDDEVKQLPLGGIFHDQVELLLCFDDLVELNHVLIPYLLQNLDLSGYPVDIGLVFDLALLQNLDGDKLVRNGVAPKLDFAEGAFAERLHELDVRNLLDLCLGLVFAQDEVF